MENYLSNIFISSPGQVSGSLLLSQSTDSSTGVFLPNQFSDSYMAVYFSGDLFMFLNASDIIFLSEPLQNRSTATFKFWS